MRTDAKVGLVGILLVAIAVVTYFVYHKPAQVDAKAPSEPAPSLTTDTPPAPTSVVIAPPSDSAAPAPAPAAPTAVVAAAPAPAYATAPAPTLLAQAPVIAPPSSDTSLVPSTPTATPTTLPSSSDRVQLIAPGSRGSLLPPPSAPTTAPAPGGLSSYPSYPASGGMSGSSSLGTHTGGEIPSDVRPTDSLIDRSTPSSGATIGGLGNPSTYTIQSGDTFSTIAKKFNTTVKAIQAANPKVDSSHLKIKQVINLPAAGSSTPSSTASLSNGPTTRPARSGATTRPSSSSAIAAGSSYTVKKGDTLRKIAKAAYGDESQWQRIFRANRGELDSADDIEVGMVLKLPPK